MVCKANCHINNLENGNNALCSYRYELNLSAKDSPLKIIRHYHPRERKIQMDNTLKVRIITVFPSYPCSDIFPIAQARGIVRFFHRKHQCYITAEGSFVGHHGLLPESCDGNDSAIATSLMESTLRRRSANVSPSPSSSHRVEVKADVEPSTEEQVGIISFMPGVEKFSISSLQESLDLRKTSLDDSSSHLSLPRHRSKQQAIQEDIFTDSLFSFSAPDDEVVAEDGKLQDHQVANTLLAEYTLLRIIHCSLYLQHISGENTGVMESSLAKFLPHQTPSGK